MNSIEEAVRRRAYELWEQAGEPEGPARNSGSLRSPNWRVNLRPSGRGSRLLAPPIVEPHHPHPPHGVPVGMPGERIVEQGVDDEGLENLLLPTFIKSED